MTFRVSGRVLHSSERQVKVWSDLGLRAFKTVSPEKLYFPGVRVYVLAVGLDVNMMNINSIASDPKSEHEFIVDSFSDLPRHLADVTTGTCEGEGSGGEDVVRHLTILVHAFKFMFFI